THALWNRYLARKVIEKKPAAIIDLCAGTGEIAFRLMKEANRCSLAYPSIELVDFSEQMLKVAEQSAHTLPQELQQKLTFIQGNVEQLLQPNESFQAATCAYGIRNVNNPEKCLSQVLRVLQPGGSFYILELTRPKNVILKTMHGLYLRTMLPLIGKWLTSNKDAYSYLQKSIETFVCPEVLAQMAQKVGFTKTEIKPLNGSIATLITLTK
ncbi:MAG TPA: ubiquinone/menaquinone biosynthesis methyltransferase, partial [Chlamydiales bacterium]|nr:ubiquinone/menaquinone biosynthesis methyltransferase [Chlamydiales bacterium]